MVSLTSPGGGPRVSQKPLTGPVPRRVAAAGKCGTATSLGGCKAGRAGTSEGSARPEGPAHPAVQVRVPRPATRSYSKRTSLPQRLQDSPTPAGTSRASSGTSCAQPGQSQAGRHEVDPTGDSHGSESLAAQDGDPWRWRGFWRVTGGERAEGVVSHGFPHSGFAWEPRRHGYTMAKAQGTQQCIVRSRPAPRDALRTMTVPTKRAEQVLGTAGLRALLRQAFKVHEVPAAGREGTARLAPWAAGERRSRQTQQLSPLAVGWAMGVASPALEAGASPCAQPRWEALRNRLEEKRRTGDLGQVRTVGVRGVCSRGRRTAACREREAAAEGAWPRRCAKGGGGGGGAGCTRHAAVALFESGAVASAPPASRRCDRTRGRVGRLGTALDAAHTPGWLAHGTLRAGSGSRWAGGQAPHGTGRPAACCSKLRCG